MNIKLNKIQNVLIILFSIFIVSSFIFFSPLDCADELWNFQNIHKMINGLKIYNDANVIITPIFYYIGFIFLKIFGNKLLVFKFYNVVIYSIEFLIVDKILKNLKLSKSMRILSFSLLLFFLYNIIISGANYNALAVAFALIGLYTYVLKKNNNILEGFILFLVFFTKQNIGIFYFMAIFIYELYKKRFCLSFVIDQIKKIIVFVILSLILIISMYFTGNLYNFINYVFLGIFDFGKNNFIIHLDPFYFMFFIIMIVFYVFTLIMKKKNLDIPNIDDFIDNLTLILIFSVAMIFIEYPIVNSAHLLMIFSFNLIFLMYFFDKLLIKTIFDEEKYKTGIIWFAIIVLSISIIRVILYMIFASNSNTFIKDFNSPFYGVFVDNEVIENSKNLEDYIIDKNKDGIDVMILSYEAAYTMINLNQSHGEYDLLFNGNLGYNGTNRVIEDIKSKKNSQFLIFTDEKDMFWQESKEIRKFIIDNLEKKGEIGKYSIYSK